MGLSIKVAEGSKGPPFQTVLTLFCDSDGCRRDQQFTGHSYATQNSEAMKAGWKASIATGGRRWLCPSCSGRVPHAAAEAD